MNARKALKIPLNAIARTISDFGRNYSQIIPYIPFAPQIPTPQMAQRATQRQQNFINNWATPYIRNQYLTPLREIPKGLSQVETNLTQGNYLGAGENLLKTGFQGLKLAVNVANPVYGALWQAGEGLKAQGAARLRGASIPESLNEMRQGFVGNKFTGLGTALTTNPLIEKPLNVAEMAVPLGYFGYKGFKALKNYGRMTPSQRQAGYIKVPGVKPGRITLEDADLFAKSKEQLKSGYLLREQKPEFEEVIKNLYKKYFGKSLVPDPKNIEVMVTKLQGLSNKGAFGTNEMLNEVLKRKSPKYTPLTATRFIELHEGWKKGDKAIFDRALLNKDAETIKRMLSRVPEEYRTKFADNINRILAPPPVPEPIPKIPIIPQAKNPSFTYYKSPEYISQEISEQTAIGRIRRALEDMLYSFTRQRY